MMFQVKKLKGLIKSVVALLAFLAGATAAYTFFVAGYTLLGIIAALGMLRALVQYLLIPTRWGYREVWLVSLPLDAVSLVASLSLVLAGGYMAVYASMSAVPSSALSGVLILLGGLFCGSAMFWRQRAQEDS